MTPDEDIARIKRDTFETLATARRVWMVEETASGFTVRQWSHDGVAPSSEYPDKRKAAARLLQLLQCGPVAPQTWPEKICIGSVNFEADSA